MTAGITICVTGNYCGGDDITFNYHNRLTKVTHRELSKEEVLQLIEEDMKKNPMYLISHPSEISEEVRIICAPYISEKDTTFGGKCYEKVMDVGSVEFGILELPDDTLIRYACIATEHQKKFQGVLSYEDSPGEAKESILRFAENGFRMSCEWIFKGTRGKKVHP